MKPRVVPVFLLRLLLALSSASVALTSSGCGSSGGGTQSATTTSSSSSSTTGDLTLASTTTSLDSSVPSSIAALINNIVSATDAKPLGSVLSIPSDGTGFSTPVFAVDSNGNLLLGALSSSQTATTQFSAKSTAETLALITLGVSNGVTASELTSTIDAAPSFVTLVADIQAALTQGVSPLTSQSVPQDLANVLYDTVSGVYSSLTVKPFAVHPQTALPTETATMPLPFTILGLPGSLLGSVYISSTNTGGSLNLVNTMPVAFAASALDTSGSPIGQTQTMNAYSLASSLFQNLYNSSTASTSPAPTVITGNGQSFVVRIDATPTEAQNLDKALADTLQFVLSQGFNLAVTKDPNLSASLSTCSQTAAQAIVNPIISSLSASLGSLATPEDLGNAFASALTTQAVLGAVQSIIKCSGASATQIAASTVIQTAATTTLKAFMAPWLEVLELTYKWGSTIYAAKGPVTELATTYYYWNQFVNVNVCETNGQLGSCAPQMSLTATVTVTPISSNGWSGSGNLTINSANGTNTYTGLYTLPAQGGGPITRPESGSASYSIPTHQAGTAFTFELTIEANWSNGPGWGGTYTYPPVTVLATPVQGGYSLSTSSYPDGPFGYAHTTVAVSGFYTGP